MSPFGLSLQTSLTSFAATIPTKPFFDPYAGHFNAGFMLISPNVETYRDLLQKALDPEYYDMSLVEQVSLAQASHPRLSIVL